jgi:WG containing repeat
VGLQAIHIQRLILQHAAAFSVFIALLAVPACSVTALGQQTLLPVRVNGRTGFIDQTGKVIVEPQFKSAFANPTIEGLACVKAGEDKYYFLDETGKIAFQLKAGSVGSFSDGLTEVRDIRTKKDGFIDKTGSMVIPPQFDFTLGFSEGLAMVEVGGKYGFIDKTGAFAVEPRFDGAAWFSEGLAAVKLDDKWGFIDQRGQLVIEPQFDEAIVFSEGRASVKVGEKWGFTDKSGNLVISPQFKGALEFHEGSAPVWFGTEKCGFIDYAGNMALPTLYEYADPFYEGLAGVRINGKWGFIDKAGKIVIKPQWGAVGFFRGGVASVLLGKYEDPKGKNGYIDRTGRYIWQPTR